MSLVALATEGPKLGESNWSLSALGKVAEWRNKDSSCIVCVGKVALIAPVIPFLIVAAVVEGIFRVLLGVLLVGFVPFVDPEMGGFGNFVLKQLGFNGLVLAYTPAMITGIFRNFYAKIL